jgi:hypothetical protein
MPRGYAFQILMVWCFDVKKLCKFLSFSEGFRKMIVKPTEKRSHMITGRAVTKGPLAPTITRWFSVPVLDVIPQRGN